MRRRHFLLLSLSLLLFACSEPPPLPPLAADAVILAFGDSLTRGSGAAPEHSYPAVLAHLTGRQVINAGVPGELTDAGRHRLPGLLDEHRPALLLLCHGGNDMLRKRDRDTLKANLVAMTRAAQERGIPVLLLGVPEPKLFNRTPPPLYEEVAAQFGLPYEGDVIPMVESDNGLKSDAIHPNAAGYRLIAEVVAQLLRKTGAI